MRGSVRLAMAALALMAMGGCAGGVSGAQLETLPPAEAAAEEETAPAPIAPPADMAFTFLDPARERLIPVTVYLPAGEAQPRPAAILLHGSGGRNTAYTFLANALTDRGFAVAAIQHELPGDPPLIISGDIYKLRMPMWRQGLASIAYAIEELERRGVFVAGEGAVYVGHSTGGDMAMLIATEQPQKVRAAYSLDHRRVPVPRVASPRLCTIRSSDQVADPGVLPTPEEAEALGIQVVQSVDLSHNVMSDSANPAQRAQMLSVLDSCLKGLESGESGDKIAEAAATGQG